MRTYQKLKLRFRSLFHRDSVEHELAEELRYHVEQQTAANIAAGMPDVEARRRALVEFGGTELAKEECREQRGIGWLETTFYDLRYALRALRKTPGFTAVAVLTLALGIGANTAIFTLIDALMLRLVPVHHAEELSQVQWRRPTGGQPSATFTHPMWQQLRQRQDVFSSVASWGRTGFNLAPGGTWQGASGLWVSGEFFSMLQVAPVVGRLISPADDQPGCAGVAVLSYDFWQRHYGGSAAAIGGTLSLNAHPFTVIGVTTPGFYGLDVGSKFDVAAPNCATRLLDGNDPRLDNRSYWWLRVVGRVKPGLSPQQVNARVAGLSPQVFEAALPQDWGSDAQTNFRHRVFFSARPGTVGLSDLREQFQQPLTVLMAVVALVLLVACANVAALMLARATAQQREIAVRLALGASRLRLVRYLLAHALLLSVGGAAAGLLLARGGTVLLVAALATRNSQVFLDLTPDWRVLAFTTAVALATAALFGLLPALRSTRIPLTAAMHGATAQAERSSPLRRWLAAAQIALSLVLLVTAGLFLRSFGKLVRLNPGFDRQNVVLVTAGLRSTRVQPEQYIATFDAIQERLRALPGIASVARSRLTPLQGGAWDNKIFPDTPTRPTGDDAQSLINAVTPGYFATLRMPLLAGRDFKPEDGPGAAQVAIVNQAFARRFFPALDPLGHIIRIANSKSTPGPPIQVVGVVADAKYNSLREAMPATIFLAAAQLTDQQSTLNTFEVRTPLPLASVQGAIEAAATSVSREVPLEFHTLAEQVDDTLVQERLLAMLSGFFGAVALLLAMIGLYGTVSYRVTLRRAEFGIRMALGAQVGSIIRLVLGEVVMVVLAGVAAGVAISLATTSALQKLLFGLGPRDATTIAGAALLLALVALVAAYAPARRAARVDPMVALRYE